MEVIDIDVIGVQPPQTGFARTEKMVPARPQIVGPGPRAECGFGRNQKVMSAAGNRLAQNLFRSAVRVNVRGIEQVHPGFKTNRDQARCLADVAGAPSTEEIRCPAEGSGAETKRRHLQSRTAKLSKFHTG